MRCCIRWYAHFKAADAGDSSLCFLGSGDGRGVSIELLMSMANSTASFTDLKLYVGNSQQSVTISSASDTHGLVELFVLVILLLARVAIFSHDCKTGHLGILEILKSGKLIKSKISLRRALRRGQHESQVTLMPEAADILRR